MWRPDTGRVKILESEERDNSNRVLVTSRAYKATCGFLSLTFFLMEFTAYFALKGGKKGGGILVTAEREKDWKHLSKVRKVLHHNSLCTEIGVFVAQAGLK